ncbi:hypothetical protein LIER_31392 [Lithospermum erythrorhizon]|uniref:Uncharacterized protein n=1 Tax=Lithospermum erythrorhizon TaxID=34254 RepID=A0AAV3RWS1_LITER
MPHAGYGSIGTEGVAFSQGPRNRGNLKRKNKKRSKSQIWSRREGRKYFKDERLPVSIAEKPRGKPEDQGPGAAMALRPGEAAVQHHRMRRGGDLPLAEPRQPYLRLLCKAMAERRQRHFILLLHCSFLFHYSLSFCYFGGI